VHRRSWGVSTLETNAIVSRRSAFIIECVQIAQGAVLLEEATARVSRAARANVSKIEQRRDLLLV
jgi:hypothetical protein